MEGLSVSKVFGVPEDYTLEQLKKSYIEIVDNLCKSDRTEVEKKILANQYKHIYKIGKKQYVDKISMEIDTEIPNHNYSTNNRELNLFDRFGRFETMYNNSIGLPNRVSYNPFMMFDNVYNNIDSNLYNNSNFNTNLNSKNSKVYSYSSSYSSNYNPDGSQTVIERKSESKNGDKKQTVNAYKKMPNGDTLPLTEDEMKQLEKITNLQIDN